MYKLFILSFFISTQVFSQSLSTPTDSTQSFELKVMPYINYGRSLGAAFGVMPMAMYPINKKDTVSPASMTSLLGLYTTNKTWFTMYFQRLYLKEDRWRITSYGGFGSSNFQFYVDMPDAGFIDYNTQSRFFIILVDRRIAGNLFGGIRYSINKTNTAFDADIEDSGTLLQGLGLKLSYDNRDQVYYPRSGQKVNLKWTTYPSFIGNEFVSNKIEIDYNKYISMPNKRDILAARIYTGIGIGDLSFQQQFIVGRTDIRGYSQGKYRGNNKMAIQAEYRWNIGEKIGFVGFAGLATVWQAINEEDNGIILPGGGAGFRYTVFPKNHMNVGLDAAIGKDDWSIAFKIGESF
ncbi:BamA/TamA family outer membrane protein [Reichenbachiella carrageenanivorans]|uniref:BamA/TamA family outer membrane protein n=1 Tax=Reichenbachiella carrageenanivorans TaxID=2979869 RepID=A0ABY6CWK7_9BACT|nr:BamA/TamA family outer membrane protein [Reichenbachiella carrageenanivorans]UXX78292.1 BamA/TamA family outer membrane protein [Reichenbachiella carrageenanivorans]